MPGVFKGFKLPGGRGPIKGPDAQPLVAEQLRSRAQENPVVSALYYATLSPETGGATIGLSAVDTNYFFPILHQSSAEVEYARVRVLTLDAGQTLTTALYVLDATIRPYALRQLPASLAAFSTTATGIQEVRLGRSILITPNQQIYIGWRGTSLVFRVGGFSSASRFQGYSWQDSGPSTELPGMITSSNLLRLDTVNVPQVLYLSEIGREVI